MSPGGGLELTPITRRQALKAGTMGLVGAGLSLSVMKAAFGALNEGPGGVLTVPQPPSQLFQSQNGVLNAHLTLANTDAWVKDELVHGFMTYNGICPGPVLWAAPGDRVLLDVTNNLSDPTNTHFHGFHVSPEGQADNIFAHVHPGETFHHDFVIPADHPGGLYWYHPHMHGFTDLQVYSGLAGLFVISGGAAALPGLADKTHTLIAIRNTCIEGVPPDRHLVHGKRGDEQDMTANGATAELTIAPGETQLWQIGNISNEAYLVLNVEGHDFDVLAEDGHLLWRTFRTHELLMPPGKRYELAITGGAPGSYTFWTLGFDEGFFGRWQKERLGSLTVTGTPQTPVAIPANPAPVDDLANEPIVARRMITLSEKDSLGEGEGQFFINGVLFQNITPGDVIQVTLGTTEEWVIRNDPSIAAKGSPEDHPFHLHINHVVVTGRGTWDATTGEATSYEAVDSPGKVDTFNVPVGEYVIFRVKYEDYPGLTVFHCHILDHEDKGMMGEVNMNPAPTPSPTTTSSPSPSPTASPVVVAPKFTG